MNSKEKVFTLDNVSTVVYGLFSKTETVQCNGEIPWRDY